MPLWGRWAVSLWATRNCFSWELVAPFSGYAWLPLHLRAHVTEQGQWQQHLWAFPDPVQLVLIFRGRAYSWSSQLRLAGQSHLVAVSCKQWVRSSGEGARRCLSKRVLDRPCNMGPPWSFHKSEKCHSDQFTRNGLLQGRQWSRNVKVGFG